MPCPLLHYTRHKPGSGGPPHGLNMHGPSMKQVTNAGPELTLCQLQAHLHLAGGDIQSELLLTKSLAVRKYELRRHEVHMTRAFPSQQRTGWPSTEWATGPGCSALVIPLAFGGNCREIKK